MSDDFDKVSRVVGGLARYILGKADSRELDHELEVFFGKKPPAPPPPPEPEPPSQPQPEPDLLRDTRIGLDVLAARIHKLQAAVDCIHVQIERYHWKPTRAGYNLVCWSGTVLDYLALPKPWQCPKCPEGSQHAVGARVEAPR